MMNTQNDSSKFRIEIQAYRLSVFGSLRKRIEKLMNAESPMTMNEPFLQLLMNSANWKIRRRKRARWHAGPFSAGRNTKSLAQIKRKTCRKSTPSLHQSTCRLFPATIQMKLFY